MGLGGELSDENLNLLQHLSGILTNNFKKNNYIYFLNFNFVFNVKKVVKYRHVAFILA